MSREKDGYRDMIAYLNEIKNVPMLMSRGQACEVLGVSRNYLTELIIRGEIKPIKNKIPIGSIARCLCG